MANVTVETLVDDDAAVAQVTVKMHGYEGRYTGSAKRHPVDAVDGVTGEALALARAFARASEDIKEMADYRVDAADAFAHVEGVPLAAYFKG